MTDDDVTRTLSELTLEQKASLLSGLDFWTTKPVAGRHGTVPAMTLTDGPHGVRLANAGGGEIGLGKSKPATCFPTAATLASTWNPALLERVGSALGVESKALGVSVLLGPGANIKRDPRCGRNFEYFSEDPTLSGDMAAGLIRGIQSQGVGSSLKHYAVNNQENDRMRVSADVDERALREVYLASFERAVAGGNPWTIMCAYNQLNGTYVHQHKWLLTTVLRDEWGWDGLVMSDWGAVRDRLAALEAGLDLEMPARIGHVTDQQIVDAVRADEIDESLVDASVARMIDLAWRTAGARDASVEWDQSAHHELAREAAAEGAVLLRNDAVDGTPLLPLDPSRSIGIVGEFARTPRYQGAGSSQVVPTRLTTALDALREARGDVPFAPGFVIGEGPASQASADELVAEAVAVAASVDTVVMFLGLPGAAESEGFDREHILLPADQRDLFKAVAAVNHRIVVVLSHGAVVDLSEVTAPALLEVWLGGQAGGAAIADLLSGASAPSGKLAETIPLRLEDAPSYGAFPGEYGHVRYAEGLLVGYRGYDARHAAVAFPFGHGLTYTSFEIDDVRVSVSGEGADVAAQVSARVTNTGGRAGAEVVQVYVGDVEATVMRPVRELRAFAKVALEPGEQATVAFELDDRAFAFWHPVLHRWYVEGGAFDVCVGTSSRDLAATVRVDVVGDAETLPLTELSTIGELRRHPALADEMEHMLKDVEPALMAMVDDMPAETVASQGWIALTPEKFALFLQRAAK